MKSVILIVSAILSVCVAQNNVDWNQVRRIHEAPPFFDDFPYLQALFQMYNAVNLNQTEGHTSTRNQFNYMVSVLCNVQSTFQHFDGNVYKKTILKKTFQRSHIF